MSKLQEKSRIQWVRHTIQALIVGFIAYVGLRHQFGTGGSPIDAYCPFGGIESLYSLLVQGKMLAKTAFSNLVLLGALIVATLIAGGFFCGWICPLGTVQDWIYAIRKRIVKKPLKIPPQVDHYLRYLKYGVLALVVIMTVRDMTLWFANYDPFRVFFHFSFESTTAYIVLGVTILLSLLIERFWCKYLCPLGALLTPLAKIGFLKVKKTDQCAQCNLCLRQCSMGLHEIGESGCTNCLECVTACPSTGALHIQIGPTKKIRSPYLLPITGILIGTLLILGSMGAGVWETRTSMSRTAIPAAVESSAGNYPPVESITGMSYLDEVAKTYDLEPAEILKKAKLDPNQNSHQTVKDITKQSGLEVEVVREAVKELMAEKK